MATLKFHLIQRKTQLGKLKWKTTYTAQPIHLGKVSFDDLCKQLAENTTVGKADVKAVIARLAETIPHFLELGYSVDCGDLGTFRASFGSQPVENLKDFNVSLIRAPRVVFTPRMALKYALRGLGFEQAQPLHNPKKPAPNKPGGSEFNPPSGGGIGI